ncbi:nicotinate (nicotinamide) nucleotide adenylyltransferase [Flagellatimonas centrodinii]|uniref:nicotinate (nicotinamide) nucleotide adenylyltransferase n=1 Tax=Flagellatimonas centrodinii TaxID=2806210 RepID=UPI001FF07AB1|nr:nicotinate (nicotinamide) nucleotide adenylyltransferase [Flagellatimonas centrodinii]ULQ47373.1 nicotinate (nicotinamide) nucleotide adenylyltransferase [Flagellatimonas centrodinii]
MKAVGLFGGAFAPFHNGHLRLALEARERLGLDQVRLVPTAFPVHRPQARISPLRRLEWVRLAVAREHALVVDDCELRRDGPSYTIDTLSQLAEQFPRARRVLLMGADAFAHFHTWHRWADILGLAELAVVLRPGNDLQPPAEAAAALEGRFHPLEVPLLDISSTRIRRKLRHGKSVRGLLPDAILDSLTAADIAALTEDENPSTH